MLYTITGATGSGKTFAADSLVRQGVFSKRIVTYTSRPPRKGEKDGAAYHFLSKADIRNLFDMGTLGYQFFYCNNVYGVPLDEIKHAMWAKEDQVIILDRYGAFELRSLMPDKVRCVYLEGGARAGRSLERKKKREKEDMSLGFLEKTGYDCVIKNDSTKRELIGNIANYVALQKYIKKYGLNVDSFTSSTYAA